MGNCASIYLFIFFFSFFYDTFIPALSCLPLRLWLEKNTPTTQIVPPGVLLGPWVLPVWAAITEHPRLGSLNNRHFLLTVLESGKFKIKVPTDPVCGEVCLVYKQLSSCCVLPVVETERSSLLFLLIRALIPFMWAPPSWPNFLLKAPPPNTLTLGS